MKMAEIREKNREDMEATIRENREALRVVRFQIAEREAKNHQEHRRLRRDIARMLTVLRERV
jgi:large subunit ribosomal protein L29